MNPFTAAGLGLLLVIPIPFQQATPQLEGPTEQVTVVTAARTEQPVSDAVSVVTVVSREQLHESPALVLDDILRSIPGFSLLRRSSSLVAHPTSQGVSLRGLGPSGASRTLVLFDGIPLNDPVGGWVYWNRVPLTALEQVEVSRGATSQLYGSSALGGTIQLIPRRPERLVLSLKAQAGNGGIRDVDVALADSKGDWFYIVSGRLFDSAGYHVVRDSVRGSVDERANAQFQAFFGRAQYKSFHAGLNLFHEDRNNGTRLQTNQTRLGMFEAGIREKTWDVSFSAQSQLFQSTFSRISPDRSSETLTSRQRIPSTALGGSAGWRPHSMLLLGADWRCAFWDEHTQNLAGLFTQAVLPLGPTLDLLIGGRLDAWQNRATQTTANPRVGAVWRPLDQVTFRSSVYRGFRSPTLNELYRPFRVGNIETLPNSALNEEYLWGTEAGADIYARTGLLVRFNTFWNALDDPVANVTISMSPTQVTRQRMNVGGIRAKGLEAELSLELGRYLLRGAYLFSDATVKGGPLRVPQSPRHQGSVALVYTGSFSSVIEARWTGAQFEDDLNTLVLGNFPVIDWIIQKPVNRDLRLFVSVENLLNRSYPVGRTPIEQIGSPRLIQAGIYLDLFR